MKPVISPEYAALNRQLHAERFDYGHSGTLNAAEIVGFCRRYGFTSVLDYGCGKGALGLAMREQAPDILLHEYDPAIAGKEYLPTAPADLLVALDVMEHIEPEFLHVVLATMRDLRPKLALLAISLLPANKLLPDGRNAHLIVMPADWWRAELAKYFAIIPLTQVTGMF